MLESSYVLPSDRVPDFSFADEWPLATKAVTYALYNIPGGDHDHMWDSLKFIYINELVCQFHGIEHPIWPFSLADTCRALSVIFGPVGGVRDGGHAGRDESMLRAFDMHEMGSAGFVGCSVAPTYPSVKHWLSAGLPVLAGIATPPDWEIQAADAYHHGSSSVSRDCYVDATVIAIVGWDDKDSTFIFRYMDSYRVKERDPAKIAVIEVLGSHTRIELVGISSF